MRGHEMKKDLLKAGMLRDAKEEMQAEPIASLECVVSVGQVAAAPGSRASSKRREDANQSIRHRHSPSSSSSVADKRKKGEWAALGEAVVNDAAGQTSKWRSPAMLPLPKTPSLPELMVKPPVFPMVMSTQPAGPPPLKLRHGVAPSTSGHVPPRPILCACSPVSGRPVKRIFADVSVGQVVAAPGSRAFCKQRGVATRSMRPRKERWWQRAAASYVAVEEEAVVEKPWNFLPISSPALVRSSTTCSS